MFAHSLVPVDDRPNGAALASCRMPLTLYGPVVRGRVWASQSFQRTSRDLGLTTVTPLSNQEEAACSPPRPSQLGPPSMRQ